MRVALWVITTGSVPVKSVELDGSSIQRYVGTQKVDPLVGSTRAFDASRGSAFR